MKNKVLNGFFPLVDNIFRRIDRKHIRRTKNIRRIPEFKNRRGGKLSYAEWAHVIGIFQTIIYQNLKKKRSNHILDIGCGTGLLGISSEPFTCDGGTYTGIDVMKYDINYCSSHYTGSNYDFIHFDVVNPSYASDQNVELAPWPVEDESKDLITALSVWTHLSEQHARYYFKEIHRVLKKEGRAILTFFYLDDTYIDSLSIRKNQIGRFHSTNQNQWIFDKKAYDSSEWYAPKWVKNPEDAIGITPKGMETLIRDTKLKLVEYYPGNWKEQPGVFFQDILIFEK